MSSQFSFSQFRRRFGAPLTRFSWLMLMSGCLLPIETKGQNINEQIIAPAPRTSRTSYAVPSSLLGTADVLRSLPPVEALINADLLARAAVFSDDTRLADFASGAFLPSAIPVVGQPFFGAGPRANLQ